MNPTFMIITERLSILQDSEQQQSHKLQAIRAQKKQSITQIVSLIHITFIFSQECLKISNVCINVLEITQE